MARRNAIKGRSVRTYKNKLRKVKTFYRLTFQHSKNQKELHMALPEKQRPKKRYFCDKFSTEKSFLKLLKIKEPNVSK